MLSVGRLVGQSVRKEEKSVFPVTGRVVMRKKGGRMKEAKGSINIGKCQDTKRCPIYTTIIERLLI